MSIYIKMHLLNPIQVTLPLCGSIADETMRDYAVMAVVCIKCAFVSHPINSTAYRRFRFAWPRPSPPWLPRCVMGLAAATDRPVASWQIEMFCTSGALMMNNSVPASRRAGLTGFSSTVCGPMRVLGPVSTQPTSTTPCPPGPRLKACVRWQALTSPVFAWSVIHGAELGFPFDRSLIFLTFGAAEMLALYICWSMPPAIDRQATA